MELQQGPVDGPKSLIVHLAQQPVVEKMVEASGGYDLPSLANFTSFKTWAEEGRRRARDSLEKTLDWAASELEGFTRN